jgi:DNA-binding phage protein
MPLNLTKIYNQYLELPHLAEPQRINSLKAIFEKRDIANNKAFLFRTKIIRPLKIEGQPSMETLLVI